MHRPQKYSLKDLKQDFPNERACLEYLFDTLHKRACECGGRYKGLNTRKDFQCSKCRKQISPTSGTIFHKSSTPLTTWFQAIFEFSSAKSGLSASELERHIGVTYKTAWRMLKVIRTALPQKEEALKGNVEIDEAFFGKKHEKFPVMGAVERQGRITAKVLSGSQPYRIERFIHEHIEKKGTVLFTDSHPNYPVAARGYRRRSVNHSKKEYARGKAHINTIEAFWGHVKRSVSGTHKVVSRKYLQSYLDGFVFHWNYASSDRERFSSLVGTLLRR